MLVPAGQPIAGSHGVLAHGAGPPGPEMHVASVPLTEV